MTEFPSCVAHMQRTRHPSVAVCNYTWLEVNFTTQSKCGADMQLALPSLVLEYDQELQ